MPCHPPNRDIPTTRGPFIVYVNRVAFHACETETAIAPKKGNKCRGINGDKTRGRLGLHACVKRRNASPRDTNPTSAKDLAFLDMQIAAKNWPRNMMRAHASVGNLQRTESETRPSPQARRRGGFHS